jgi:hypothetical protein
MSGWSGDGDGAAVIVQPKIGVHGEDMVEALEVLDRHLARGS